MTRKTPCVALSLCMLAVVANGTAIGADSKSTAEQLFASQVLPLLKDKCFACHGDDSNDIRGELNMLSRDGLLAGGESGEPSLVPGEPHQSPMYLAVLRDGPLWSAMPPKDNDKLSIEQVQWIERWIAAGSPWPDEPRRAELARESNSLWNAEDGIAVRTSGGLTAEWTDRRYRPENLWEYQPLWKDDSGRLTRAGRNPIDVLIDERLARVGLEPAPPADRRSLIRRATFDLVGLPPTPEQVDEFINDPAPDDEAFARVVERLLHSPHYGEQWGRHWLDVVRYADSAGYANDYERGNAWRYRDYVVRALNDDKPYDQFILEQIAGDEMLELERRGETASELLVAVGFLRMGPWELTGMEVAKVARQRFLDDVTDAVGQTFLGHMLQCARCHDHKFDPVPTRDYYSIQAAFATTQLVERSAPFLPQENTSGFEEQKYLRTRQAFYEQTLRELEEKRTIAAARQWYREQGVDATAFEDALAELQAGRDRTAGDVTVAEIRNLLAKRKVHPDLIPPQHVGFEPRDFGLERIARKGLERLRWRLDRYEPIALSVYSGRTPQVRSVYKPTRMPRDRMTQGELEQTCILVRGDPFSPTEQVRPDVLSVIASVGSQSGINGGPYAASEKADRAIPNPRARSAEHAELEPTSPPADVVGRRLALARWVASAKNPLTARVMVNRIWQWHFGRAIAGNPNNFGTTGKKPTHPELLDYLAQQFIEGGWSEKAMHRLIMNSSAYRRSSRHPDPGTLARKDPDRTSYAAFAPRRLDAEELRDAMLHASGELNAAVGGIPARPEMNLEAALQPRQVMGTFAEAWQPSPLPAQRHRRSLYALRIRGQRDPFMEVFNAPSSDLLCEARDSSTVTPQVFAMFNSEASFDRALAFANRLLDENLSREQTVDRAFQWALSRSAKGQEIEACLAHWDKMTARHKTLRFEPPVYPREVVRQAVEENTGEKFTFVEPLEAYADFVPDLKPCDASPEVRGLAEVCLVLFNSNEFAYVY